VIQKGVVYQTYHRVLKKAATYNVSFLIYIDLKIINFLRMMVIRRNCMNARRQSGAKSVIDGKNDNLHILMLVAVPS
jgi:hypothetical protein